ncbi:hypothetical protein [Argonema galeatum]|uniref:hypothetical protein n=1 Tax=Argonema galeatum TaxID=2942762 RepID=UPI002010E6B5|nr:hypothetical protein [Argonema galeatum]MCL1467968.1 hypothetical protein [Argonema galeatum A003/A1]
MSDYLCWRINHPGVRINPSCESNHPGVRINPSCESNHPGVRINPSCESIRRLIAEVL